jgi:Niemann-Pick C1 protein
LQTQAQTDGEGHCIWYGVCNLDAFGNDRYCSYNGTAKTLDNSGQESLMTWCSHLLVDNGDGVKLCCDNAQVSDFRPRDVFFYNSSQS